MAHTTRAARAAGQSSITGRPGHHSTSPAATSLAWSILSPPWLFVQHYVPIIRWLPHYEWRDSLIPDALAAFAEVGERYCYVAALLAADVSTERHHRNPRIPTARDAHPMNRSHIADPSRVPPPTLYPQVVVATPEAIAYAGIAGLKGANGLYGAVRIDRRVGTGR